MSSKVNNQKHLTLEQRNYIEQALNQNMTFKEISKFLGKDNSTISKEVKKHRVRKSPSEWNNSFNHCSKRALCRRTNVCATNCTGLCKTCRLCNSKCEEFEEGICIKLQKAPYVCNSCYKRQGCRLTKYYYISLLSYKDYRKTLTTAREGVNITEEDLCNLDNLVSPLIKQGLSIAHIYANHKDEIPCDKRTLYNYVEKNYLSICNLDLPRKVRYKKRRTKRDKHVKSDAGIRKGRTYQDFLEFTALHPDLPILEMDTVEGKKGGKVLLTIIFRNSKLMLAFLLNDKTSNSVIEVFNYLEEIVGEDNFEKIFPVILTDNGSEFSNPLALEFNSDGIGRTRIFYCDPNASYQKGTIEKNHEFIRYIIPKGFSMDKFVQQDINTMINHINSVARDSINGSNPFDLGSILIGKPILDKLQLRKIDHDSIVLKPELLRN